MNRIMRVVLLFFVVSGFLVGTGVCDEKPVMYFFYSKTCEHCMEVKREYLPGFLKTYGDKLEFRDMDVEKPGVIDTLFVMEDRVGVPEADKDYPAIYFLGTMLEGEIPVRMRLESVVTSWLANPDSALAHDREVRARTQKAFDVSVADDARPVYMAYFYKHGCKECGRAEEIIDWLKGTYPYLSVDIFDIGEEHEKLVAATLGIRSGMPDDRLMSTPVIFVGGDHVLTEQISRETLSGLVENYASNGAEPFWRDFNDADLAEAKERISNLFQQFTALAVAFAGLADGVNPCAFATILFFVSYLGMVGRKGKEILLVGLSFAFAVFMTYFLVGLGFFKIVRHMAHFEMVAKVIFGGTGALCIVFGFMSVGDYLKARAGKVSDMSLQLPAFLKRRIHATIRERARMESFVIGALVAGFMVSVLEFACTGQVYLPAITLIVRQEGVNSMAVLYLLLYNICFIIPLLVVFGFVYFGMSSQGIARVMERRVGTVKLILAGVFFTVGGLLLWTILH